jgi:hypothetical protein
MLKAKNNKNIDGIIMIRIDRWEKAGVVIKEKAAKNTSMVERTKSKI